MKYKLVSGPHTHSGDSSIGIMYLVILALLPAAIFGSYSFGLPAAILIVTTMAAALLAEIFCLQLRKMSWSSAFDGSAFLTGLLLALSLPPTLPLWMGALGSFFAIVIGKHVFGGLGNNLFNPAMLARVMLLICFPLEMTSWVSQSMPEMTDNGLAVSEQWLGADAVSAATPLGILHDAAPAPAIDVMLKGFHAGSLGEVSVVLLLAGALFLLITKVISWVLPAAVIAGLIIPAAFYSLLGGDHALPVSVHLFSGATIMVAFFIATDYVTSPTSARGQWLYGIGIGFLMFLIRTFGNYPEGAAFAVLIMNSVTPVIDHYVRPTIFGSKNKSASEAA